MIIMLISVVNDTLIIVDVGTLGIDSTGIGMDVGIITGGGGVLINYYRPATQFNPRRAAAA
jgi:hypothetical protein